MLILRYIFVDADAGISEADETNNQMASSYAIDAFSVFSVTAMGIPSQINPSSTLKIPFAVTNTGSQDIPDTGTSVGLSFKERAADIDVVFNLRGIEVGIGNGETVTLDGTADTSALTLGTYEVDITVTNRLDLLAPVIFETPGSFSVVPSAATIGNRIWNDLDADGIQDPGEPGGPLVRVDLEEQGAGIAATAYTDVNGKYSIPVVPTGTYRPVVTLPQGYAFTSQDQGADDTKDSDVDATGMGTFSAITAPATDDTFDVGLRIVPDIELISLTSQVDSSRLATVSFQVANNGTGVQTYRISVFNGRTTPPTCTSPGADYTEVVSLAPGEVLSRSLSHGLPAGAYTTYVFLDSDCLVAEGTETNNIFSTSFTLEPILPIPAGSFPGLALLVALMVTALTWLLWRRRTSVPG